jgi:hypothetical protein
LALLSAVVIGLTSAIASALTLAATALIVPGTGTPDANVVAGYRENARDYYMGTTGCNGTGCTLIGINYPASFFPIPLPGWCRSGAGGCDTWDVSVGTGVTNLDNALTPLLGTGQPPVVLFGYSQGAAVVSNELRNLTNLSPDLKSQLSAVLIGNIDRPNGGLWSRFGFLGHIPILDVTLGLPTPTGIGIPTTDIAFQYDGVADFPLYPINLLADLNAIAGFEYIHGTYLAPNANSSPGELPDGYTPAQLADQMNPALHPENFQTFGDTTYITIPTRTLPIVQPFLALAAATGTTALITPIVDLVSPTLRVLIDLGYNRSINPGIYTPAQLIPVIDPVKLVADLAAAVPAGITAALADLGATVTPPAPIIAPKTTATPLSTTTPLTLAAATAVVTPTAPTPVTTSLSKPKVAASTSLSTPVTAQAVTGPSTVKTNPATADTNGAGGAKSTTSTGSPPSTATVLTPSKPTTTTGGTTTTTGATTSSGSSGSSGTSTGAGASTGTGSTGKGSSTGTGSSGGASSGAAAA